MRPLTFALSFAAALSLAPSAFASPTDAEQREAEGKVLFDASDYANALPKFVQACALAKSEVCMRHIALIDLALGHFVEAQRDLGAYLEHYPPTDRAPWDEKLKAAWAKTGHLKIKADDGAQIVVDAGEPVAVAPVTSELAVTPGKHTILAKKKGVSFGRDVDAPAGKVTVVDLVQDAEDDDDASTPAKPKPAVKTEKYRATGAWIGGGILVGLGVVGLGVGIGAAVASHASEDDVRRLYAPGICAGTSTACNAYRDAVGSQNTAAAISVAGYVTAGVLAATGFLVWAIWPKAERPIVTPTVSPTSLGLSLGGTF